MKTALLCAITLLATTAAAHADPVHVVIPDDYEGVQAFASLVNSEFVEPDRRIVPTFWLAAPVLGGTAGDLLVFELPPTLGECYRAVVFSGMGVSLASSREICVTANGLEISE